LAQGVKADVFGRGTQYGGIVLELAETSVAVEAQQRSDGAGLVIMIDMYGGRHLADRTESVLLGEQKICLG
jgi:hypothetical protein